jgi:hypothetical protein
MAYEKRPWTALGERVTRGLVESGGATLSQGAERSAGATALDAHSTESGRSASAFQTTDPCGESSVIALA